MPSRNSPRETLDNAIARALRAADERQNLNAQLGQNRRALRQAKARLKGLLQDVDQARATFLRLQGDSPWALTAGARASRARKQQAAQDAYKTARETLAAQTADHNRLQTLISKQRKRADRINAAPEWLAQAVAEKEAWMRSFDAAGTRRLADLDNQARALRAHIERVDKALDAARKTPMLQTAANSTVGPDNTRSARHVRSLEAARTRYTQALVGLGWERRALLFDGVGGPDEHTSAAPILVTGHAWARA